MHAPYRLMLSQYVIAARKPMCITTEPQQLISHSHSTIVRADCIYVMDKGRIAESGEHSELLEKNGIYAALWAVQTGQTV